MYAGIGAWTRALNELGIDYNLIDVVENDENTIKNYNLIHSTSYETRDADNLIIEDEGVDMVVYSPPCQSFSRMGKEEGFDDSRGIQFFNALEYIKIKKPKFAVMENVEGLAGKKFQHEFQSMLKLLEEAGYRNYYKVLNALDYGIPQNRKRVFIVSIRNDVELDYQFPVPEERNFNVLNCLDDDAELPILSNIYGGFKEKKPRLFNNYSPAIRTAAGGGHIPSVCTSDPSKVEKVVAGYNIRQFTPRECLRLMGFRNEDYEKLKDHNKATQIYRNAGNSIPVGLVKKVIEPLF